MNWNDEKLKERYDKIREEENEIVAKQKDLETALAKAKKNYAEKLNKLDMKLGKLSREKKMIIDKNNAQKKEAQ